jgi:hypothetical protein
MRIALFAVVALAACGGPELAQSTAADAVLPDVSGSYTFNQYLFYPFNPAEVGQTGQMTITQSGNRLTASATLRYPVPFPPSLAEIRQLDKCSLYAVVNGAITCVGPDIADEVSNRQWSGTVETKEGTVVVRLFEPSGSTFTAQRDAAGSLRGECLLGVDQPHGIGSGFRARCDALTLR